MIVSHEYLDYKTITKKKYMSENQDFPGGDSKNPNNNANIFMSGRESIEIPSRGRPKKRDSNNGSQEIENINFYNEKSSGMMGYYDNDPRYSFRNDEMCNISNKSIQENILKMNDGINLNSNLSSGYQSYGNNNLDSNNFQSNYQINEFGLFGMDHISTVNELDTNRVNQDFPNRAIDPSLMCKDIGRQNFYENNTFNTLTSTKNDLFGGYDTTKQNNNFGYKKTLGGDATSIYSKPQINFRSQTIPKEHPQNVNLNQNQNQQTYRSQNLGGIPNEYFMNGNPWINRKKRKGNPLLWQYMQQNKDFHPGLVHPKQYSSVDYIQGMERSQKMFLGCVKRQHSFPDKNTPNYTVLPLFLNSTSYYENHIQNQEFEKIALVFIERCREIDYENVTVQQLKILMKEFGLNHTGKKCELIERVQSSLNTLKQKLGERHGDIKNINSDTNGQRNNFMFQENNGDRKITFQENNVKPNININKHPPNSAVGFNMSIKNSLPFQHGKIVHKNNNEVKEKPGDKNNVKNDIDTNCFGDTNHCDDFLFF